MLPFLNVIMRASVWPFLFIPPSLLRLIYPFSFSPSSYPSSLVLPCPFCKPPHNACKTLPSSQLQLWSISSPSRPAFCVVLICHLWLGPGFEVGLKAHLLK